MLVPALALVFCYLLTLTYLFPSTSATVATDLRPMLPLPPPHEH
jgi:hypothetical protein